MLLAVVTSTLINIVFMAPHRRLRHPLASPCRSRLRLRVFQLILPLLIAIVQSAVAGTFYIDYVNGSDTNSGTNKSSPWKKCPGMPGFGGSYSHAAGDRFIFKGGVTWPTSSLPLTFGYSGTSGAYDYYGVDQSWHSGGSWSRPIFDKQRAGDKIVVFPAGRQYIQLDNIDIRNVKVGSGFGVGSVIVNGNSNITISKCWIHAWYHVDPLPGGDQGTYGGIINNPFGQSPPAVISNFLVTHCDIGSPESGGNSGGALYYPGEVAFCKIHDVPNAILLGGGNVHDNEFYNIRHSYDPAAHDNLWYLSNWGGNQQVTNVPAYFYNNYIHDCTVSELLYPNLNAYGTKNIYIYNNVVTRCSGSSKVVDVDTYQMVNGAANIYIFNNTFEHSSATFIRVGDRRPTYAAPNRIDFFNNHFIGGGSQFVPSGTLSSSNGNNVQHTSVVAAALAGFKIDTLFAPSLLSAITVGKGVNKANMNLPGIGYDTSLGGLRKPLKRPATGNWSIGAYEFTDSPVAPPGPTATPSPTPASSPGGSATPAPTATPTASPTPPTGLVFDADAGTVTAPFVLDSSDALSQSVETLDPNEGGEAVYRFVIDQAGSYAIQATVNAPSEGSNSVFINIDADPENPTMIWHIPTTSGRETRTVSWQGTGSWDNPQYVPAVFNLTEGTHQLILRGREANAKFQKFSIVKMPSPPTGLRITTGP